MELSAYHQSVLQALTDSGVCSAQQLADVEALLRGLSGWPAADAPTIWRHVADRILLPAHDFASVHQRLAAAVYAGWPAAALGRPPLWLPDPHEAAATNVARFIESVRGEAWWQAACARYAPAGAAAAAAQGTRAGGPSRCPPSSAVASLLEPLLRDWAVLQAASWDDPEAFWPAVLRALGVAFQAPPARALDRHPSDPDLVRWLPGARLNIAHAALSCSRAPPGAPALLWAPDGRPTCVTAVGRGELAGRARHVAACLLRRFRRGAPIALYLPMSPDAVAAYLGVVLAGCVAVSVADSFSSAELRTRMDIAGAEGVITQDFVLRGGKALPLYDKVVQSGTQALAVVLSAADVGGVGAGAGPAAAPPPPPLRPGDMSWRSFRCLASPGEAAALEPHVPADPYETTNILFSSGTTGEPKAIPWSHLTPLRCCLDGWACMDVRPGSRVAWPSSLGWMMGPWLLYAALLNGATAALYGGAPLGRDFLQFVTAARVDVLGLVPAIVRAWRHGGAFEGRAAAGGQRGREAQHQAGTGGGGGGSGDDAPVDLSCVRLFGSTGEASAAEDYAWLMSRARGYRPVIEYCGGTEIGGGYLSCTPLHPCAPSTFATPTLGARVVLLAEGAAGPGSAVVWDGAPAAAAAAAGSAAAAAVGCGGCAASGEVALAMPMLGCSQRLLNRDHHKVYYGGMPVHRPTGLPLRRHGDEVAVMPPVGGGGGSGEGGVSFAALGRCDDTMNLGGIKVSSVELERAVVEGVAGVVEAAAVGVAPPGGGPEELHLFLVLAPPPSAPPQPPQGQSPQAGGVGAGGGAGGQRVSELQRRCQEAVRTKLNPLFKVSRVVAVSSLPRNASNKVMRRLLRDTAPGRSRL